MDSVFAFLRTRPRHCILLPSCQGRDSTTCCPLCKSANRPAACAKVQTWETSSGPRSRPSGLWHGFSGPGTGPGQIQIPNLYPNPNTRTWLPTAETRDLKGNYLTPLHLCTASSPLPCPRVTMPTSPLARFAACHLVNLPASDDSADQLSLSYAGPRILRSSLAYRPLASNWRLRSAASPLDPYPVPAEPRRRERACGAA